MPSAAFARLPDLDHTPQMEDPDAFNQALIARLNTM